MKQHRILEQFFEGAENSLIEKISASQDSFVLQNLSASAKAFYVAKSILISDIKTHFFILPDKEQAAYFYNDLEALLCEEDLDYKNKSVLFFPTSYRRPYEVENYDNANVLMRSEVLSKLAANKVVAIVTYPEAITEKVITKKDLKSKQLTLFVGERIDIDYFTESLYNQKFTRTDFVYEPGYFTVRGGIIDVFSFGFDKPFRIEWDGDDITSIRSFDVESQTSLEQFDKIEIISNIRQQAERQNYVSVFEYLPQKSRLWIENIMDVAEILNSEFEKCVEIYGNLSGEVVHLRPEILFLEKKNFITDISDFQIFEFAKKPSFDWLQIAKFNTNFLPHFNKNFDLIATELNSYDSQGYKNIISSNSKTQIRRIDEILKDHKLEPQYETVILNIHEGFVDNDLKIALISEHHIFNRYHRYKLREKYGRGEAITLKEIYSLKPGDFIVHVDHGVGRYGGLEKIEVNGKEQEAIRLMYKNDDILYISIHSLHRISKFSGKDGAVPTLDRIGSNRWNKLKEKAKSKVKDIAKDLILLYAKRKQTKGFAYAPDTYLQTELEASFIYEDTPDQIKATQAIKEDMQAEHPMDRLVCGDVGFGKTEIAIRAAFKAVADGKQVAVLVPTTILALQHYHTFSDRLHDFPCDVDYINRFKTTKQQNETLKKLAEGKIDILIGTHRLLGKDIEFKDLGLFIIDEEQKFGVSAKEKLRQLKVNVDTLTLTATPIPRTLQFSLMGARDLSIINTPPPNRYPIDTQVHIFNEELIRDAIQFEISRQGQVFFVHNRISNIHDIATMLQRNLPDIKICVAHGQMGGEQLEDIMIDFMEGRFDVLVSTTIIESGLDIPNANTIIINEAQNYGLSDLHQLRGRVGRSNKKAFCYLLTPPRSVLTEEAHKRLNAIEQFSDLGSGFNIAMRDLDIRGAGNILGAEQSGFISEIGYETYQNIINESIQELKENEFKSLFANEKPPAKECFLETDLTIIIPDSYVQSINERLSLYMELDNSKTDQDLAYFSNKLKDIYGAIPDVTQELILSMKLRLLGSEMGFEKIVLKNSSMRIYFDSNTESPYFQSEEFTKILAYVQTHPQTCKMRQKDDILSLTIKNISNISNAISTIIEI